MRKIIFFLTLFAICTGTSFTQTFNETEPNDSFEQADLVTAPVTVITSMGSDDDVDFFKVDLVSAGVMTVTLSEIPADQMIKLFAYNSEQNQIAYVVSLENGTSFEFDVLFPSGVSYFMLYDYRESSDSIHLDLELSFDNTDGCEDNNSFETACLIEPDTILHPQLFGYNYDLGGGDTDYYKVEAGIILNQCFTISNVQPGQLIKLYVYDEDHSQIGYARSPETGSGFLYCLDFRNGCFLFQFIRTLHLVDLM